MSSLGCLFILWHYGRLPFFYEHIAPAIGDDPDIALYAHLHLTAASVVTRSLLPLFFIIVLFRERPGDWGYRLKGTLGLGWIYLGLLAVMLPVIWFASGTEAFQSNYPQYSGAREDTLRFIIYEASYFLLFLSGESFWRGYMVFGLKPKFGYYAIFIMTMPYCMVHWGKPWPETMGAIVTGCVLGYLALRHKSFWLGVALHFSIAFLMDFFSLMRQGALPWAL